MKILLIPSAILVPEDMRGKYGHLPTVLYPLNDTTMLEHICQKYTDIVDQIVVVGYEKNALIEDYIKWKKIPAELVIADKLGDLGYTIYCGMKHIMQSFPEVVYINFADTLIEDDIFGNSQDYICYSLQRKSEEWTFFEEYKGKISKIIDKRHADNYEEKGKVFVGAFAISAAQTFQVLLEKALKQEEKNIDSFYMALEKYSEVITERYILVEKWFDAGHVENYCKAKTGVKARAFNLIQIDETRGILKKKSTNAEKFVGEINWYIKMPKRLQYLLPRIYDYALDGNNSYVEMEYYGYPTLHELLIWGEVPLIKWQEIFRKLLFVMDDMGKYTVREEKKVIQQALADIYIKKTIVRLDMLRNNMYFKDFFTKSVVINGIEFECLDYYVQKFTKAAQRILIDNYKDDFTIIHGDFCFANILVEENYKFIRLIDPRGEFGGYDIYGDSRYELAKLFHSLEGKYDYIIEDMFDIQRDGMKLEFRIPKKSEGIFDVFTEVFKAKLGENIHQIRLIEASLFLSMIPLHNDYLKRQYAMLVTGLNLLKKVLEEIDV